MQSYANQPLGDIDAKLAGYGWSGSWRIQEDAAESISSTLDSPPYLFPYLPFVFVVDTASMEIVAADGGDAVDPENVDVLAVLAEIAGGG